MIVVVVSYSECNVLTGHHCVLEIFWSNQCVKKYLWDIVPDMD